MARPRVRNRILLAARALLDKQGAAALTTRAVAEEAGVTEASVFNNFGDKGGLVQAIIQEAMPEYEVLLRQINSEPTDGFEAWFGGVFYAATRYFLAILPLTAPYLTAHLTPTDTERAEGYYTPRRALERRFKVLQKEGNVDATKDPKTMGLLVMGAAMHTGTTQLTLGQSDYESASAGKDIGQALGLFDSAS